MEKTQIENENEQKVLEKEPNPSGEQNNEQNEENGNNAETSKENKSDMTSKEKAVESIETNQSQKVAKFVLLITEAKLKNRIGILLNHLYGDGDIKKNLAKYLTDCINRDFEKIRSEL